MNCETSLDRCLSHVVNLANIDVMGHITKIAAVENSTAIWEYDPKLPDNRVLGGSLDVIAAIRTIAIKVRINTPLQAKCLTSGTDPGLRTAN